MCPITLISWSTLLPLPSDMVQLKMVCLDIWAIADFLEFFFAIILGIFCSLILTSLFFLGLLYYFGGAHAPKLSKKVFFEMAHLKILLFNPHGSLIIWLKVEF